MTDTGPGHRRQTETGAAEVGRPAGRGSLERIGSDLPKLLTLREVARCLGVSYAAARSLVIYQHLPNVELPCPTSQSGAVMRRRLVLLRDLEAFIERHRRGDNVVTVSENRAENRAAIRRRRDGESRVRARLDRAAFDRGSEGHSHER